MLTLQRSALVLMCAAMAAWLGAACERTDTPAEPAHRPAFDRSADDHHDDVDHHDEKGDKILCFDGTTDGGFNGVCKLTARGADLNTFDGDDNPNNNYAGVFPKKNRLAGVKLSKVKELSFSYAGGPPTGGSPRFSIAIDADGDGTLDAFAFVDVNGCNDGDGFVGTLDVIHDQTCTISYATETHSNWAAFAAAHPTARIARDQVTFAIDDQPGHYLLFKVRFGGRGDHDDDDR